MKTAPAVVLPLALSACTVDRGSTGTTIEQRASPDITPTATRDTTGLVGPDCAAHAVGTEGAADPLAAVAARHPHLTTLVADAIVGTHQTVQGAPLEVAGTPDALTVNGARVLCGTIPTRNATLYLVDAVLVPPTA